MVDLWAYLVDAPWRFFVGLSPSEVLTMWGLKWAKYAHGWKSSETYIEQVSRLATLEDDWRGSRLYRWLKARPKPEVF